MADDVVDVGEENLCEKKISCRIEVAAKAEFTSELAIVIGAVLVEVDDVAVVEILCKLKNRTAKLQGLFGAVLGSV